MCDYEKSINCERSDILVGKRHRFAETLTQTLSVSLTKSSSVENIQLSGFIFSRCYPSISPIKMIIRSYQLSLINSNSMIYLMAELKLLGCFLGVCEVSAVPTTPIRVRRLLANVLRFSGSHSSVKLSSLSDQ